MITIPNNTKYNAEVKRLAEEVARELLNTKTSEEIERLLQLKVDKEKNKGLSSNDYTSEDKTQVGKIGALSSLITTAKDNLVSAINEVKTAINNLATSITTALITSDKFRSSNTNDAGLTSTNHAFQIGEDSGINLIMDNNEIIGRNNGVGSPLHLNYGIGNENISINAQWIVERGSNANGEWVRLYDGTQIVTIPSITFPDPCNVTAGNVYRTSYLALTSPVAFVDAQVAVCVNIKSYARWGNGYTLNGTSFYAVEWATSSGANAYDGSLVAVGRWY